MAVDVDQTLFFQDSSVNMELLALLSSVDMRKLSISTTMKYIHLIPRAHLFSQMRKMGVQVRGRRIYVPDATRGLPEQKLKDIKAGIDAKKGLTPEERMNQYCVAIHQAMDADKSVGKRGALYREAARKARQIFRRKNGRGAAAKLAGGAFKTEDGVVKYQDSNPHGLEYDDFAPSLSRAEDLLREHNKEEAFKKLNPLDGDTIKTRDAITKQMHDDMESDPKGEYFKALKGRAEAFYGHPVDDEMVFEWGSPEKMLFTKYDGLCADDKAKVFAFVPLNNTICLHVRSDKKIDYGVLKRSVDRCDAGFPKANAKTLARMKVLCAKVGAKAEKDLLNDNAFKTKSEEAVRAVDASDVVALGGALGHKDLPDSVVKELNVIDSGLPSKERLDQAEKILRAKHTEYNQTRMGRVNAENCLEALNTVAILRGDNPKQCVTRMLGDDYKTQILSDILQKEKNFQLAFKRPAKAARLVSRVDPGHMIDVVTKVDDMVLLAKMMEKAGWPKRRMRVLAQSANPNEVLQKMKEAGYWGRSKVIREQDRINKKARKSSSARRKQVAPSKAANFPAGMGVPGKGQNTGEQP